MNVHLKYKASSCFSSCCLSLPPSLTLLLSLDPILSLHGEVFFPVVIFILSQLFPAQVVMETNLRWPHRNQIWSMCVMKQAPGRRPCCPVSFTDTQGAEIWIGSEKPQTVLNVRMIFQCPAECLWAVVCATKSVGFYNLMFPISHDDAVKPN